jgi:hypothetical protein
MGWAGGSDDYHDDDDEAESLFATTEVLKHRVYCSAIALKLTYTLPPRCSALGTTTRRAYLGMSAKADLGASCAHHDRNVQRFFLGFFYDLFP